MFILQLVTVDVLSDEAIRQGVKEFSDWPTIPQVSFKNMPGTGIIRFKYAQNLTVTLSSILQLYVAGEFIGGSDIMIELYQSGELGEMIEKSKADMV